MIKYIVFFTLFSQQAKDCGCGFCAMYCFEWIKDSEQRKEFYSRDSAFYYSKHINDLSDGYKRNIIKIDSVITFIK